MLMFYSRVVFNASIKVGILILIVVIRQILGVFVERMVDRLCLRSDAAKPPSLISALWRLCNMRSVPLYSSSLFATSKPGPVQCVSQRGV